MNVAKILIYLSLTNEMVKCIFEKMYMFLRKDVHLFSETCTSFLFRPDRVIVTPNTYLCSGFAIPAFGSDRHGCVCRSGRNPWKTTTYALQEWV